LGGGVYARVRATVIDAYQRDYDVFPARDCIASYDREHHDVSWRYMDGKLGRGMTTKELVALLRAPGTIIE
jgi:isochorismate hydrolase